MAETEVIERMGTHIPFAIITCDGGSHRRKDRPNGGLYVFRADASTCLSTLSPREVVVVSLADEEARRKVSGGSR